MKNEKKIKATTLFRMLVLDELFAKRTTEYSAQELVYYMISKLETEYGRGTEYSQRQLNNDLQQMRKDIEAPIQGKRRERNTWYYRYSDPNYTWDYPAYQAELSRLGEVIVMLDNFRYLPHQADLAGLKLRLVHHKNKIRDVHNEVLVFKSLPLGPGEEHVAPLYEAITNRKTVVVEHLRYNCDEVRRWPVHPYSLVEYERHWYLYCYSEGKKSHMVFALDRIKSVTETEDKYKGNDIPAEIYFKDIIGVTRLSGEEVQDIELLVSPDMAPYFLSKPLHHSQYRINPETEHGLHIGLRVMINRELIGKLLNWGGEVRVLKSERLLERMREEAKKLADMYSEQDSHKVIPMDRIGKVG